MQTIRWLDFLPASVFDNIINTLILLKYQFFRFSTTYWTSYEDSLPFISGDLETFESVFELTI